MTTQSKELPEGLLVDVVEEVILAAIQVVPSALSGADSDAVLLRAIPPQAGDIAAGAEAPHQIRVLQERLHQGSSVVQDRLL